MNSITVEGLYDADESHPAEVARLPRENLDHLAGDGTQEPPQIATEELVAGRRGPAGKRTTSSTMLYAGVGLVALLIAGGYIFLRPASVIHPSLPTPARIVHQKGVAPQGLLPLAPSATLANVPVTRLPPAIVHQKYVPQSPSTELSELDQFQAGAAVSMPGTTIAPLPASPGSAHKLQQAPLSVHPAASTHAAQPHSGASSAPEVARLVLAAPALPPPTGTPVVPAGRPQNVTHPLSQNLSQTVAPTVAVEPGGQSAEPAALGAEPGAHVSPLPPTAAVLGGGAQPNTLSPAQQTQVFQLVTDLATMERDDRLREAVLTGEVQQLSASMTNVLADYNRRLSLLEAQTAVSDAMQAGTANAAVTAAIGVAPVSASPPPVAPAGVVAAPAAQAMPAPAATPATLSEANPASPPQYHVQAASPGLAMLSVVGGDAPPLEVQVGDIIPGYGKVVGVVQQGNSWVVQTQSGNIQ